jgi:cytochrome P450
MTQTQDQPGANFPMRRGCPLDPPPEYGRLREEEPISRATLWNGQRVWLVTRFADVVALLGDSRLSARPSSSGYPQVSEGVGATAAQERTFLRMDPPEHDVQRRMIQRHFTVKRVEAMRVPVQRIVDELTDALIAAGPGTDFVKGFGLPLPSQVISLLIGAPYEDHEFVESRSSARIDYRRSKEDTLQATGELLAYLDDLVTKKEQAPGDDVLSALITEHQAAGELSHGDIVAIGRLLISAGHETTANMLSLGLLTLLQNDDQRLAFLSSAETVVSGVEELLRYLTIIPFSTRRAALDDIDVGGITIKAGEGVFLLTSSANRDTAVFPGGDQVNVQRDARRHLAFGYGVHQCLGQNLARLELQIALSTLLRRLPSLRLDIPFDELRFTDESVSYGVRRLPLTW